MQRPLTHRNDKNSAQPINFQARNGRLGGFASVNRSSRFHRKAKDLKELVAEQTLELRLFKTACPEIGTQPRMRYPASETLEIIRLVEENYLSVRRTLAKLVSLTTFYRWCGRYLQKNTKNIGEP